MYLPHLHNIVGNMIPKKMVDKRHGLLFRVIPVFVAFNTTLMLSTNTGVGLDTLISIGIMCYRSITDSATSFFRSVNPDSNFMVFTAVYRFDDHVVGVDPTTEKNW